MQGGKYRAIVISLIADVSLAGADGSDGTRAVNGGNLRVRGKSP